MNDTIGFIILRHVTDTLTNTYWIRCYESIRKYYPENKILIIDDSSNYSFITDEKVYNTTVIRSEYPKRGELLPYYYYLHTKLFDIAVLLHDSVFINKYIDFSVAEYKFLWDFEHHWDRIEDETLMINMFNDLELKTFHENKQLWEGSFGAMCIIRHEYLKYINSKYDISKLLECVLNRDNRIAFERVIGCLLQKEGHKETLLGDINKYCFYGGRFHEMDRYKHLPIIKIWTGR